MDFIKKMEYFVGIDSDGTAFDSMTIKHTDSFIPAAIEIFKLQECEQIYREAAERINLFSLMRGINRFPGLLLALQEMQKKKLWEGNVEELEKYIKSGYALSNTGLETWIAEHPSDFMEKVLAWSRLGDVYFKKLTLDIPPFDGVAEAVEHMRQHADIMVVSAASAAGLMKDWGNAGLAQKVSFIAGQEFGGKDKQLLYAVDRGFDRNKMLMIGDAPGDYEAAKKAGIHFYPVIPGKEKECWNLLCRKYFNLFITGQYDEITESALYQEFLGCLKGEA
ncbi:MAG: HAD family hydrolase [Lachnospiraceae bacterium]|nr:HAD family hydrolase [Lachnospiraceae bacterium]